jgi:hypothetical protein
LLEPVVVLLAPTLLFVAGLCTIVIPSPSSVGVEMMSNKLDRRLRLLTLVCLMKYFCACDATCVGVLVVTKCREIPRQSPFPSFCNPIKKFLCSSSVHATPRYRTRTVVSLVAFGDKIS